jgi:hypothetical protein
LLPLVLATTLTAHVTADESVPFTYHQRCIFLTMRLNEQDDLLFLLDTGASASAVDATVAKRLKLPAKGAGKVEGTTGVLAVEQVLVNSLSAGAARADGLTVTSQNLGGSLAPAGRKLDGILGYDFLRRFALTFDFHKKTVTFSSRPVEAADGTVSLPVTLDNGIPRIAANLNQVRAELRLDTGASLFETKDVYVNVPQAIWETLKAADPALTPTSYLKGSGTGGEVQLPVARLNELSLGRVTVARPFVIVQPRQGYFARPDAVGFISNNLLEKYSPVTVDYLGKVLILTPAKSGR